MTKYRTMPLDTETCNIIKSEKVMPGNNLPYDIGFSVVEPSTGKKILERSYIVREIFFGERERMQSAYYAEKLPQYLDDIASGKRKVASAFEILNEIDEICKRENVIAIVAHNARFDIDALNTLVWWLSGNRVKALPQNLEIWDTMKMWNACKPKAYTQFCEENNYKTNHKPPRDRLTAEIIYRFLTGNNEFAEAHTGLEDVNIETEIMLACYKSHKPIKEARVLYQAKA